MLNSNRKTS